MAARSIGVKGRLARKVVAEAVLDDRADGDLGLREESTLHRVGVTWAVEWRIRSAEPVGVLLRR